MTDFKEIRPYRNGEVAKAAVELASDEDFQEVLLKFYPNEESRALVLAQLKQIKSIEELQEKLVVPALANIEQKTTDGLTFSAMKQFSKEDNYLIISNHRDIILDPAFLNVIMLQNGFKSTEVAIGNNLLIYNWIKNLVRLNRCFIVKRNLGIREQLSASKELSAYIRHTITHKEESVWIAQREGRTKNGDDKMQPALLKMLLMSSKKPIDKAIKELKIVPMAISYEIEPCIISKVEELLNKRYNPDFVKSQGDDLRSMANGMMNPKGRVHFGFGNPVNWKIDELCTGKDKNEVIQSVVEYIDKRIYYNYKLWPNNYMAYNLLHNTQKYAAKYTIEQLEKFEQTINKDISTLQFDKAESRQLYLEIYANPVINFERTA